MTLFGKTLEQWKFTTGDQLSLLIQWQTAERYQLTTKAFCQSLVDNGTDAQQKIGRAGLSAPSQGLHFVDVLEGWLPAAALSSLRAADKAGVRSVGIDTAILQLQGGENIVGKLARILAFPYLLSVVMGVYGVYISDKMLSAVEHQAGIGLSVRDAVATFGAPLALLLAAGMVALSIALPRWAHPSRRWSHNWPIFSLYRVSVAASVLHTLGNLTQCGMKLGDALIEAQHRNTPFACWHLRDMQRRAIGQSNLGTILDTGLLLPTELSALKVLGERVSYAELLTRSGDNHQAAVTAGLSRLTTWLPKAALGLTIVLLGSLIMSAAYQLYLSFL